MMTDEKDFRKVHARPLNAIRVKCLECVGFQRAEVPLCTQPSCPLYPYRMGRRPRGSKRIKLGEAVRIVRGD